MEKAREIATTRARYQSRVVQFINKNVSGIERRIARQGHDNLFGYVLEMLSRGCPVEDGRISIPENELNDWALSSEAFRNLNDYFYLPGKSDEHMVQVLELGKQVVIAAVKCHALTAKIKLTFSEDSRNGSCTTTSRAWNLIQHHNAMKAFASNIRCGAVGERVEVGWYYLYPRNGVSDAEITSLCIELCQAIYGLTPEEMAGMDRYALYRATPQGKLMDMLERYCDEVDVSNGGFMIGNKPADRMWRTMDEFGALPYEERQRVHTKMNSGMAALHTTGGQVLCYANERDYERGRCSVLPLARWIRTFGEVSDAIVQQIVNAMRVGKVEYLHEYKDWYNTYVRSRDMGSCMAYESTHFEVFEGGGVPDAEGTDIPLHPVWCYADHEVIRLAVVRRGNDVVARAIVNPDRMEFYRVYGDFALKAALIMEGYTESEDYLDGITLRSILVHDKHLLHPYVDGEYSQGDITVNGRYAEIELTNCGELDLQNTDGGRRYYTNAELYCDVCGCTHTDGDGYTVVDEDGDDVDEVCYSCYRDSGSAYNENGYMIHNAAAGATERCAISGDLYLRGVMNYSEYHDALCGPDELRKWEEEREEEEEDEE